LPAFGSEKLSGPHAISAMQNIIPHFFF